MGLLPEVSRRGLYRKKGFGSIYEFAAKLAGISHEQVNRVLRLEARLATSPVLRSALVEGRISVNKLIRIVPIVSLKNERDLLAKAEILSSRALEVFVREAKNEDRNGFGKGLEWGKSVHVHGIEDGACGGRGGGESDKSVGRQAWVEGEIGRRLEGNERATCLQLDEDVEKELLALQDKGIDINSMLRQFLADRQAKIEQSKVAIGERLRRESEGRAIIGVPGKRYVPVEVRRMVEAEYGTRCAMEGCGRAAEILHHEKGFAEDDCHDPRFLKPLCRVHHELAHAENQVVQKFRRVAVGEENWGAIVREKGW